MNTAQPQIYADERRYEYLHSDLTDKIIGVFYQVYNELGFGFLEAVYHQAMCIALRVTKLRPSSGHKTTGVW